MKKILIMLLSLLCLCTGCSKEVISNPASKKAVFLYQEDAIAYISENYDRYKDHYFGSGILTLKIEGKELIDGDIDIIPVYEGEKMIFVILGKDEIKIIDDEQVLNKLDGDKKFVILQIEDNVCLFDTEGLTMIDGESSYTHPEELSNFLKKEFGDKIPENLLGKDKSIIKMKEPKGDIIDGKVNPKNDHILIQFQEGDITEQISMYEDFCKGKCETGENTAGVYIFYFDALSDPDMNKLVEDSNKLDYVKTASIDHENELIEPVTKTE